MGVKHCSSHPPIPWNSRCLTYNDCQKWIARLPLVSGRQPSNQHDKHKSCYSCLIIFLKVLSFLPINVGSWWPFSNTETGTRQHWNGEGEGEIEESYRTIQKLEERAKTFAIHSSMRFSPINRYYHVHQHYHEQRNKILTNRLKCVKLVRNTNNNMRSH